MKQWRKIIAAFFFVVFLAMTISPSFGFNIGGFVKKLGEGDKEETKQGEAEKEKKGDKPFAVFGKVGKFFGAAKKVAMDSKIGPVDEFFLGREVSARILGAYEPLSQKNPATDYVRKVGSSLSLYSHYPFPYRPYTYCVLKSNEINAFAAPGGFIFITTGMLNFLENEDELATILGHEIGHVELQHGINAVGQENVIKLLSLMAELVVESSAGDGLRENQLYNSLFNKITEKLMNKVRQGYNVEMESEADMRGIELSQLAGYDPKVFPKVLARLKKIKNNYGGANYPKERMADAIKRLKSMPECQGRHVSKVRSNRFASATRSVTN